MATLPPSGANTAAYLASEVVYVMRHVVRPDEREALIEHWDTLYKRNMDDLEYEAAEVYKACADFARSLRLRPYA